MSCGTTAGMDYRSDGEGADALAGTATGKA